MRGQPESAGNQLDTLVFQVYGTERTLPAGFIKYSLNFKWSIFICHLKTRILGIIELAVKEYEIY